MEDGTAAKWSGSRTYKLEVPSSILATASKFLDDVVCVCEGLTVAQPS